MLEAFEARLAESVASLHAASKLGGCLGEVMVRMSSSTSGSCHGAGKHIRVAKGTDQEMHVGKMHPGAGQRVKLNVHA